METIPSDATSYRYNQKKKTTNYFKNTEDGIFILNSGRWEKYNDGVAGILPISNLSKKEEKPVVKRTVSKRIKESNEKVEKEKYSNIFPTFKEEVFERIPEPVLRQLLKHYKDADVIEVEINVKTTHTIKG